MDPFSSKTHGHVVFLDLETTGLDPNKDRILEIAMVVMATSDGVPKITERWSCVIGSIGDPADTITDPCCLKMHDDNGLLKECRASRVLLSDAERMAVDVLRSHGFVAKDAVIAGNSIHFDRQFVSRWMPDLHRFLSHRMIDVSALRELMTRVLGMGGAVSGVKASMGEPKHRALPDAEASILEVARLVDVVNGVGLRFVRGFAPAGFVGDPSGR